MSHHWPGLFDLALKKKYKIWFITLWMQYVLKSIPTNNFKTILLLLLVFLYMNFPIGWHEKKKRLKSHLSYYQRNSSLTWGNYGKERGKKTKPSLTDKRSCGDRTSSVEEIRGRQSQQWLPHNTQAHLQPSKSPISTSPHRLSCHH